MNTKQEMIQEAWIRFEKAVNAAPLAPWEVEKAIDELRDELLGMGLLDVNTVNEETCNG